MKSNTFLSKLDLWKLESFSSYLSDMFSTSQNVEEAVPEQYLMLYNMGDVKVPTKRQKTSYFLERKKFRSWGEGRPGEREEDDNGKNLSLISDPHFACHRKKDHPLSLKSKLRIHLIQDRKLEPLSAFPCRERNEHQTVKKVKLKYRFSVWSTTKRNAICSNKIWNLLC